MTGQRWFDRVTSAAARWTATGYFIALASAVVALLARDYAAALLFNGAAIGCAATRIIATLARSKAR